MWSKISDWLSWHFKRYTARDVLKAYENGKKEGLAMQSKLLGNFLENELNKLLPKDGTV